MAADLSQGVPLTNIQSLVRYWATDYDWRKVEARLSALPELAADGGVTVQIVRDGASSLMRG